MSDTTLLRLTLVAALLAAGLALLGLFDDAADAPADRAARPVAPDALAAELARLTERVDALLARPAAPPADGEPAPITTPSGLPLALRERLDALDARLDTLTEQLAAARARLDDPPPTLDAAAPMDTGALYDLALRMQPDEKLGAREHFLWRPRDWLARYGTPSAWDHSGNTWWWQYEFPEVGNPTPFTQLTVVFTGGLTSHVGVER